MSRIVSPLPPVKIIINIDKRTGVADMTCSEEMPFEMVSQSFAALMIQVVENRLKTNPVTCNGAEPLPFEIAIYSQAKAMLSTIQVRIMQLSAGPTSNNPFENPFGKPAEKPAGNAGKVQ
jgi:hypothetical protein